MSQQFRAKSAPQWGLHGSIFQSHPMDSYQDLNLLHFEARLTPLLTFFIKANGLNQFFLLLFQVLSCLSRESER